MGIIISINPLTYKNQVENCFKMIHTRSADVLNASESAEAIPRPMAIRPFRPPFVHIAPSPSAATARAPIAPLLSTSSSSANTAPEGSLRFQAKNVRRRFGQQPLRLVPVPRLPPPGFAVGEMPQPPSGYNALAPSLAQSSSSAVTLVRTKNLVVWQSFVGESESIDVPPAKVARRTESGAVHAAADDAASESSCELLEAGPRANPISVGAELEVDSSANDISARAEQHPEHPTSQELKRALQLAFFRMKPLQLNLTGYVSTLR